MRTSRFEGAQLHRLLPLSGHGEYTAKHGISMTDKDMSLLCATWVMAWATIAAALAAIVSALFARKAVSDQAKNFAQQIADYRLALSADTALKFDASFNDPKFQKIRSRSAERRVGKECRS